MNEKDEAKIRKILKASPKLTPPESFYRGVLERIERKSGRAEERAPWFWGYPAKALATACVLMVIVLVTRETKKTQPELMLQTKNARLKSVYKEEARPAPRPKSMAFSPKDLSESQEAQGRLRRDISDYVKNPSPFEEIDKVDRKDLTGGKHALPEATPQSQPMAKTRAANVLQARDTVNGVASQGSFLTEQKALANKQQTPPSPALAAKRLGGIRAKDTPFSAEFSAPKLADKGRGLSGGAKADSFGDSAASSVSGARGAAAELNSQLAASTYGASLAKGIQKAFEIAGPVAARQVLQKTIPAYPPWAMDQGLQGTVRIYVRVSPDGTVNPQVRITRTTGYPNLDQLAVDAVKKWQFSPASEDSWGIITFRFTPNN